MDKNAEIARLINEYHLARDLGKQQDSKYEWCVGSLIVFFGVSIFVPPLFVFFIPFCLVFWFQTKPDIEKKQTYTDKDKFEIKSQLKELHYDPSDLPW